MLQASFVHCIASQHSFASAALLKPGHDVQVEVSSPHEDNLERVRQITLEKQALAQQRAQADRAKQVFTAYPISLLPHTLWSVLRLRAGSCEGQARLHRVCLHCLWCPCQDHR